MNKTVLIFPTGMPRALAFLAKCLADGTQVIGASSVTNDPTRLQYPVWEPLPYITDPDFESRLKQVIAAHSIEGIFTAHPVVWNYLNKSLAQVSPGTILVNASPTVTELEAHRAAVMRANETLNHGLELSDSLRPKVNLSLHEISALFRHTEDIPGMCDHEKVRALYEVFRHCPEGDVVEIGSWWGKSAFVLLWLAKRFGVGSLLCVDPWSDEHLVQHDEGALVDTLSSQLSAAEAFEVFQVNLLPYASNNANYLRMPSTDAQTVYSQKREIASLTFGTTNYAGRIAFLHIDGNHTYENVSADLQAWLGHVVSGGWIVLDDYTWPFGDGPKRVGDEFLQSHRYCISTSFVMGGALFVQLS